MPTSGTATPRNSGKSRVPIARDTGREAPDFAGRATVRRTTEAGGGSPTIAITPPGNPTLAAPGRLGRRSSRPGAAACLLAAERRSRGGDAEASPLLPFLAQE